MPLAVVETRDTAVSLVSSSGAPHSPRMGEACRELAVGLAEEVAISAFEAERCGGLRSDGASGYAYAVL